MAARKDKKTNKPAQTGQPAQVPPVVEMTDRDLEQVTGGISTTRVNETITNLSRSQSDAEKSITQNLSV